MTASPAAPGSSGAGPKGLPHRILFSGIRRAAGRFRQSRQSRPTVPSAGLPPAHRTRPAANSLTQPETAAPKKLPAAPRPAAKTPPRPGRQPSLPAETASRPRITGLRTRRRAPLAVTAAALLVAAGGAVALLAGLQSAMDPQRPVPAAAAQLEELGVPADVILSVARIADAAVAAVVFGIYLLLASLIRDGRNWARVGCCILVAAALFLGLRDAAYLHVTAALLAGVGTGLLFLPRGSGYFTAPGRTRRRAGRT